MELRAVLGWLYVLVLSSTLKSQEPKARMLRTDTVLAGDAV